MQAAAQLKVKWAESPILPGHANLWTSFRKADSAGNMPARITGTAGQLRHRASSRRRRPSSASFMYPYNGHNPIGPACAVADYKDNGGPDKDTVTVFSNTQNIPSTVADVQAALGLAKPNQVRIIYYEGSSSYGNGYHYLDINDSAALISKLAGAPIRLQLMRWDEQGWTRYGPAIMHDMRGGVDDKGNIVAYEAVAFAQASTNDPALRVLAQRRRPRRSRLRRHERREPRADVQRREQRARRSGLPARVEDADAGDGHVPERHAARAVGPADHVRVRAVHRHARDPGGHGSVQLPPPEHAQRRPGRPAQRVAALRRRAQGRGRRRPATSRTSRARSSRAARRATGWGMAIGTHNDSYAAHVAHVEVNKKTGKVTVLHL